MKNRALKFASLFSGCGGFDLGFTAGGFQSSGAYDLDPDAVDNFRINVGRGVEQADLSNGIPNEDSLKTVDVLIAGPPCQGFSTAGKRMVNDDRNHLLTLTGTLALRVAPKVLIVENVLGSLSGAHAKYFEALDVMMKDAGYMTNLVRCQASDLGMPQVRKRILFFAWKTNREINFEMPKKEAGDLRSALAGANKAKNHHPKLLGLNTKEGIIAKRIKPGQKLSNVRGGSNAVATWDIPEVFGEITEHERTVLELLRRLRRQERKRDFGDADPVSLERLEAALGSQFHSLIVGLITKGYLRHVESGIDLVGTFNGK
jgi:DNA (cytosine-5)-methyltransferase 1